MATASLLGAVLQQTYEAVRRVGEGRMGEAVYEATHARVPRPFGAVHGGSLLPHPPAHTPNAPAFSNKWRCCHRRAHQLPRLDVEGGRYPGDDVHRRRLPTAQNVVEVRGGHASQIRQSHDGPPPPDNRSLDVPGKDVAQRGGVGHSRDARPLRYCGITLSRNTMGGSAMERVVHDSPSRRLGRGDSTATRGPTEHVAREHARRATRCCP